MHGTKVKTEYYSVSNMNFKYMFRASQWHVGPHSFVRSTLRRNMTFGNWTGMAVMVEILSHEGYLSCSVFLLMMFQLRMAALNEPCTGDMTGVRGADYSCYRESRRAGLRGTFRAFLSSRVQNLDSIVRFSDRDLPVVNIKVIFTLLISNGFLMFHQF